MSLEKAELKVLVARNLGVEIDDQLEGVRKEINYDQGAQVALGQAQQQILGLQPHVKKDLEEGKIKDGMTALEVTELCLRWVARCAGLLQNLKEMAKNQELIHNGKAQGLEAAVKTIKAMHDREQQLAENIKKALADEATGLTPGAPGSNQQPSGPKRRATGVKPDATIKDKRRGKLIDVDKLPKGKDG